MSLIAIWAQAHDRVIGKDGAMPWYVPEDLAHFRVMTMGDPVIMGRTTWEGLDDRFRPLPGRRNIVLTRSGQQFDGAETVSSLDEAAALVAGERAWIMGGAQVYEASLPFLDGIVYTDLDITVEDGDAFAPSLPSWGESGPYDWEVVGSSPDRGWHTSQEGIRYRFTALAKRGRNPWGGNPLVS